MSDPAIGAAPAGVRQRTSALAIASFVLSLVVCLCGIGPILAIVFGLIALVQIQRRPQELTGRGIAWAGVIIGIVCLLGTIAFVAISMRTYRAVDPITENALRSLDEGNAAAAMRDFDSDMAGALPADKTKALSDSIRQNLGRYESRRWGYVFNWNKVPGKPATLTVAYRVRYTHKEVTVTVIFRRAGGRYEIGGLWFDAPELQRAIERPVTDP